MVYCCHKDDFAPELDQFNVWRVEWWQEVWLGAGIDWSDGYGYTAQPSEVLIGYSPIVGTAHEPQYENIDGTPR